MRHLTILAAGALALALAGCGGKKDTVTVQTDGGKATVTADQAGGKATTTIETPQGKATVGAGTQVSEAELGMPMYPGATNVNSAKVDVADGQSYTATFETTDSVDKVIEFYKPKLPGARAMQMSSGDTASVMLMKEEGKTIYHVQAVKSGDKTMVTLVHAIKK